MARILMRAQMQHDCVFEPSEVFLNNFMGGGTLVIGYINIVYLEH